MPPETPADASPLALADSTWTGLRRLVEAYTPDGTLGRLGLGAITGAAGVYALMLAFGFLVNPWTGSLLLVPGAAVAGVLLTVLAALTCWPVYLSAIGRIESPAAYPDGDRAAVGDDGATIGADGAAADRDGERAESSPVEALKTRYQRGELTEAEFERELEALLEGDGRPIDDPGRSETAGATGTGRTGDAAGDPVDSLERTD